MVQVIVVHFLVNNIGQIMSRAATGEWKITLQIFENRLGYV